MASIFDKIKGHIDRGVDRAGMFFNDPDVIRAMSVEQIEPDAPVGDAFKRWGAATLGGPGDIYSLIWKDLIGAESNLPGFRSLPTSETLQKRFGAPQGPEFMAIDFLASDPFSMMGKTIKGARQIRKKIGSSFNDRLKRAKEMGFNVDKPVFHGSTFDISQFGGDKNPEGAFGSAYYFTSNPKDASVNYTEGGADLNNKILNRMEMLEADGLTTGVAQRAKKEIMGQAGSVVYPVYLREGKVFDLRKGKSSYLESEYPDPFEQDPDYWLRQTGGNIEKARELAEEDRFMSEPSGAFVDFYKSVTSHPDMSSDDRAMAGTVLGDYLVEGISSKNLEKVWNEIEMYPENEAGQFTKSEVFRQGIEDAGFDSIKHDANRFKGMKEVQGTEHTIIFNPKNVRSINADFDPEKIEELDILSQLQKRSEGLFS